MPSCERILLQVRIHLNINNLSCFLNCVMLSVAKHLYYNERDPSVAENAPSGRHTAIFYDKVVTWVK